MEGIDKLEKPIAERLREGVTLLEKIKSIGIADTDPGYTAIKTRIDAWIRKGESWSGIADFFRHGRRAYVTLPMKIGAEATVVLKVWKF